MAKEKVALEHKDKLGRVIPVGACVAFPDSNTLYVGVVQRYTPKMVEVKTVGGKYNFTTKKYPIDMALLEGPDVTMFLLMNER